MLIHIWSTSDLWVKVRNETSMAARIRLGSRIMAFSGSHRIEIDCVGLKRSCPLLLGLYEECEKHYRWPHAAGKVKDSINLDLGKGQTLPLMPGTFFVIGPSLKTPNFQKLAQSIASGPDSPGSTPENSSGQHQQPMDKTDETVQILVLSVVTGLVGLWEMMPTGTMSVSIPAAKTTSLCARPASAFNIILAQRIIDE